MDEVEGGNDGISVKPIEAPIVTKDTLRLLDINDDRVEYGRRAGEGFVRLFDTWPSNIDSEKVRQEGRIDSPNSFWGVWNSAEAIVMLDVNEGVRQEVLADKGGDEAFKKAISTTKASLEPLIQAAESVPSGDPRGYFTPFNADPVTCDVSVDSNQAIVTYKGMENVGGARNRVLAEIAAASNFYGRLWEKPEAQQAFLKGLLSGTTSLQELERRTTIARSVATFGTLYMSKYPMNPEEADKGELPMAKGLLSSLPDNLTALQSAYENQKTSLV